MAGINIVDEVKQIDSDGNIAKIDGLTGSAYTMELEHGIIHEGKGFFIVHDQVVDAGENFDILFVTPSDKDVHLMHHKVTATSSPGEFCLFESTTVSASGDIISSHNCNRQSPITPSLIVSGNPSIDTLGTQIDCDIITGSKLSGGITTEVVFEWILKRSTTYLFRYTNASGIRTDINVSTFHMEL